MKFSRRLRFRLRAPTKPGAPPGTLVIDPDAAKPTIRAIAYDTDGLIDDPVTDLERLRDLLHIKPVTWVNVDGLGDADVLRGGRRTVALSLFAGLAIGVGGAFLRDWWDPSIKSSAEASRLSQVPVLAEIPFE